MSRAYYQRLTWDQCARVSYAIWGQSWRRELRLRCGVTARTVARWRAAGVVPPTVSVMLNAFHRLRYHRMTLPEKEGCAP